MNPINPNPFDNNTELETRENDFVTCKLYKFILYLYVKHPDPSQEEWEYCCQTVRHFYDKFPSLENKVSLVLNFTNVSIKMIYNFYKPWNNLLNSLRAKTAEHIHRSAIITNSSTIENSLNIFVNLYGNVRPVKFVSSMQKAMDFVFSND